MTGWDAIRTAADKEHAHFLAALSRPRRAQLQLLREILSANANSAFGRMHGFAGITAIEDYRARVPIRTYDAFEPDIAAMASGESNRLTAAEIVAFEETGGTASGGKLIPYTAAALAGFRRAILPWLADLMDRRPGICKGPAYVSISPATRAARATRCGIPIGLPSEGAYLGAELAADFTRILAVPTEIGHIGDVETWRTETLAALVRAHDLSFVSVWSPTFFSSLLDHLASNPAPVLQALAVTSADAGHRARLEQALKHGRLDTGRLWPHLDTVSCWSDGASAGFAKALAARVPHAHLEPKGLLATEAAIIIPWSGKPGCVPALLSSVIEFTGEDGSCLLCDELEPGSHYRIVITTHGGLYRYDMGDRVKCVSVSNGVPRIVFLGRAGATSDLVGEKLTEDFAARCLAPLGVPAILVPIAAPRPGYVLCIDAQPGLDATLLAETVERALAANPQYAYARRMGQLQPLRCVHSPGLFARHSDRRARRGGRLSDVKPVALWLGNEPAPCDELQDADDG